MVRRKKRRVTMPAHRKLPKDWRERHRFYGYQEAVSSYMGLMLAAAVPTLVASRNPVRIVEKLSRVAHELATATERLTKEYAETIGLTYPIE